MSGPTTHSGSSILLRLKSETKAEHLQIEQAINLPRATSSLASYAALLARLYGFYAPFEDRLVAAHDRESFGLDLMPRLKRHLLAEDLRSLGPQYGVDVPLCHDLPSLSRTSSAWGSLYVLEGSTLGGQIISRMIESNLGITAGVGGRFFQGYGSRTGEMWTAFGTALSAYADQLPSHEMIIDAARETFQKLRLWLEITSVNNE